LAADLRRGFGLEVPHVLVAGAAGQVDVDDRLGGGLSAFRAEEVGEGEAAQAHRADLEEIAARDAVAAGDPVAGDGQHGSPSYQNQGPGTKYQGPGNS